MNHLRQKAIGRTIGIYTQLPKVETDMAKEFAKGRGTESVGIVVNGGVQCENARHWLGNSSVQCQRPRAATLIMENVRKGQGNNGYLAKR